MNEIENFIYNFRKFGRDIERCFMEGNCYYFFEILKTKFPETIPYYSSKYSHVVSRIGDNYYDIRGKLSQKTVKDLELVFYQNISSKIKKEIEH